MPIARSSWSRRVASGQRPQPVAVMRPGRRDVQEDVGRAERAAGGGRRRRPPRIVVAKSLRESSLSSRTGADREVSLEGRRTARGEGQRTAQSAARRSVSTPRAGSLAGDANWYRSRRGGCGLPRYQISSWLAITSANGAPMADHQAVGIRIANRQRRAVVRTMGTLREATDARCERGSAADEAFAGRTPWASTWARPWSAGRAPGSASLPRRADGEVGEAVPVEVAGQALPEPVPGSPGR
jgi:hypothetical protein